MVPSPNAKLSMSPIWASEVSTIYDPVRNCTASVQMPSVGCIGSISSLSLSMRSSGITTIPDHSQPEQESFILLTSARGLDPLDTSYVRVLSRLTLYKYSPIARHGVLRLERPLISYTVYVSGYVLESASTSCVLYRSSRGPFTYSP